MRTPEKLMVREKKKEKKKKRKRTALSIPPSTGKTTATSTVLTALQKDYC